MPRESISPSKLVKGQARLGLILPGSELFKNWCHNDIMMDWATIVINQLSGALDGKQYKIGGMYLEFENNGGAAVSPPDFERSEGIDYYNGLSESATVDYLRAPLIAATKSSTDEDQWPGGNKLTYYGQTAGTVGVHGKPFNDMVDSRIFGAALVAFPVYADATQDLIWARLYFPSDEQIVKIVGSQISCTWEQDFA